MLRARAAQARTVGNNKLASEIWVAILTLNPGDELAYMNALTTLNLADEIGQAQKLAQQWDTSKLNGYVLAFGGMALARLGMGHKAKELLLRAASEEGVEGWPTNHLRTLAQGLILYGRYDLARRFFPTEPQDQIKADCAIVDPGHSDGPGHHATYNIFFSEFIEAAEGSLPTVAINRDCVDETLKGYRPDRQTIFQPYAYNNMALGTAEITGLNASFRAEMAYIFKDNLPQTLIVHSMRSIMLGGFVDWLESLGNRRPPTVIIGIIEADHLTNKTSSNHFSKALKTSLKKISKLKIDNLILFAETAQAVDWLQKRIPKTPVHKLAYLAAGRAVVARTPNSDDRTQAPIFGITGGTRVERGFEHIFKAILTSKSQTEKWCVQVDQEVFATFGRDPLYSIDHVKARAADRVTLLKGSLTDVENYEALGALDCLVLPYSGRYAVSGSGVLYEAIYSRKYIIVSGGSTLASELKELGYPHRLIDMKDPDSVMNAVAQTQAEWPDITAQIAQFFANEPTLPLETFQTLYTQGKQAKANKSDENFRERISAFLLSIMDRRAKKTDK
jgi:glycosyltransferase involved in cell wall biosynthesis